MSERSKLIPIFGEKKTKIINQKKIRSLILLPTDFDFDDL